MPDSFLDALGEEFHFDPPRKHGVDAGGIGAGSLRDGCAERAGGGRFRGSAGQAHAGDVEELGE